MKSLRSVVGVAILPLLSCAASAAEANREKAAEASAVQWLALVDAGKYGDSWDAAAVLFRKALTRAQWEDALGRVRAPLGKLASRKLRGAQFMTQVPGAPDGEYVVIQYETSFANKAAAIETITPMRDKDGVWRVSGYFIK